MERVNHHLPGYQERGILSPCSMPPGGGLSLRDLRTSAALQPGPRPLSSPLPTLRLNLSGLGAYTEPKQKGQVSRKDWGARGHGLTFEMGLSAPNTTLPLSLSLQRPCPRLLILMCNRGHHRDLWSS